MIPCETKDKVTSMPATSSITIAEWSLESLSSEAWEHTSQENKIKIGKII